MLDIRYHACSRGMVRFHFCVQETVNFKAMVNPDSEVRFSGRVHHMALTPGSGFAFTHTWGGGIGKN